MDIIQKYLEFLWNSFQFDMHVFSQGWMYYYLLIPAIGYLVFFFLKWIVLTAPVWLPPFIIIRTANLPSPRCEVCIHKTVHSFEDMDIGKVEEQNESEETKSPAILN